MRAAVWMALALVSTGLAGCIGTTDDDLEEQSVPDIPDLVDPLAALEAGKDAANIESLGDWLNGNGQEVDAWGDLLFVDHGSRIAILDVSDPGAIEEVGAIEDLPGAPVDVKVSDDGQYLFIGDDAEGSSQQLAGEGPLTGGIYVYDVSDPSRPEFVSFQPVGPRRGPHMVFYLETSTGDELVFGANADISIHRFDRSTGELTELSRYQPNIVTEFDRSPERIGPLYNTLGWAHDMFVMEEDDGTVLMYVANWDAGLRVVDVSDPSNPTELGKWMEFADDEEGNLHTVSTAWIGDRRITVGSVEVGFGVVGGVHYAQGQDKPVLYVWDTTDPANIELLASWVNPIKPFAGRSEMPDEEIDTTHNVQLEDGRVYLAHYGLGAWVLDVSTPQNQSAPQVLAYQDTQDMNVWDVVLNDGVMYTSGAVGVLALHYTPDVLSDGGITSRA